MQHLRIYHILDSRKKRDGGSQGSTSLHQLCSLCEMASTVMLMAMASSVGYAKPG